jgi:hypothetical protein
VNFTSHEYVGFVTYSQCVSSIELNACKDEWVVAIEVLQEGKNKTKKATKKRKKKKWFSLWAIHQDLKIGCKMGWATIFKPQKLMTTIVSFLNYKKIPFFM